MPAAGPRDGGRAAEGSAAAAAWRGRGSLFGGAPDTARGARGAWDGAIRRRRLGHRRDHRPTAAHVRVRGRRCRRRVHVAHLRARRSGKGPRPRSASPSWRVSTQRSGFRERHSHEQPHDGRTQACAPRVLPRWSTRGVAGNSHTHTGPPAISHIRRIDRRGHTTRDTEPKTAQQGATPRASHLSLTPVVSPAAGSPHNRTSHTLFYIQIICKTRVECHSGSETDSGVR